MLHAGERLLQRRALEVEHEVGEAERCDRLALMNEGAVLLCDTPAGLKQQMPGAMLEVVSGDPRGVRDAVASLPGVLGVLVVGTGAHVHVDDASRAAQIAEKLSASGIETSGVSVVTPSVEDLFVAFLGGRKQPA